MKKIKIPEISNGLFVLLLSFIISFVITFYFVKDNILSIFLAVAVSLFVFCLYSLYIRKKTGKLAIKREDEESYIKCVNAMCFLSREQCEKVIFDTLSSLNKSPVKTMGGITVENKFFYFKFSYDKITVTDIIRAYKKTPQSKNLCFIGISFSQDCEDFINGFESRISLIPFSKFFPLIKKTGNIPDGGFLPKKRKAGFKSLLISSFSKKKIKPFTFYGLALIIMSNFVFFPIWYIISGCLFLIYAILIKFFAPPITSDTFL